MQQQHQIIYCEQHPSESVIFICLYRDCSQDRLGCQKCLLKVHGAHIKSCVLIKDLLKSEYRDEMLQNDAIESSIVQFVNEELVTEERLKFIAKQIHDTFKTNMKEVKKSLKEQEKKEREAQEKKQKEIKEVYADVYEFKELKQKLSLFEDDKITEKEVNEYIDQLLSQKQLIESELKQNKLTLNNLQLDEDYKNEVIDQISGTLDKFKDIIRKNDSLQFYKSQLSKDEDAHFEEKIPGKQFIFNENDEVQLIFGKCILSKGVYEFQVNVQYYKNEDDKKDEQAEGLDSIIPQIQPMGSQTQHPIGGHINNTGLFAGEEYTHLNRLFIGVVEDSAKDNISSYSMLFQTQQCCALDVIRGAAVGQFHMKANPGEKTEQISSVFKKQMNQGLVLTFKINLDDNKLHLTDSNNQTRYEGYLQNMSEENLKPYILCYKSNLKVTID